MRYILVTEEIQTQGRVRSSSYNVFDSISLGLGPQSSEPKLPVTRTTEPPWIARLTHNQQGFLRLYIVDSRLELLADPKCPLNAIERI